jgi:PAS domain S-box-containing protein
VSELQKAEEALRRSEHDFRTLAEAMPQIVWTALPDGQVDYVNPRLSEYMGKSNAETLGLGWLGIVHPDNQQPVIDAWRQSLATGAPYQVEQHLRRQDGVYRWHLTRALAVRDAHGQVRKWVGTSTDIDDLKQAEQRLRFLADASRLLATSLEMEATLRRITHMATARMADYCSLDLFDEEQATLLRVEVAAADPSLQPLLDRTRPYPPLLEADTPMARAIRSGRPTRVPVIDDAWLDSAARNAEHRALLGALHPRSALMLPLEARGRRLGFLNLISAREGSSYSEADMAFAEELARRASAAIDNARLYGEVQEAVHARDEFLCIAGHELRTPLTILTLYNDRLLGILRQQRTGELPPEKLRSQLEMMARQTRRLTQFVHTLLDVSRISSGRLELERERLDLSELVREVCTHFEPEFERAGTSLSVSLLPGVTGHWDPLRLEQVLTNLVANALRYGAGKPVRVRVDGDAQRARFVIQDSGIGIPPESLSRIFGRFERLVSSRHNGGMGLGLWICRQVVEAHGGDILVESEPGQGSTFTVTLPRDAATPSDASSPSAASSSSPG